MSLPSFPTVPDPLEYDPEQGDLILSRYSDGMVREAIQVRTRLVDAALRDVVIVELRRLGYTVTPPTLRGIVADWRDPV